MRMIVVKLPLAYEREAISEMVYEQHKKYLAEKICCANCDHYGRDCAVGCSNGVEYKFGCHEFLPKG